MRLSTRLVMILNVEGPAVPVVANTRGLKAVFIIYDASLVLLKHRDVCLACWIYLGQDLPKGLKIFI